MKPLLIFILFLVALQLALTAVVAKTVATPLVCDIVAKDGRPMVVCVKWTPGVENVEVE